MGSPGESIVSSEGGGDGNQGRRSLVPERLSNFLEEMLPLMAEDLRSARIGLGITPAVAAERAELDPDFYGLLEAGNVARNKENVDLMLSTAQFLGMKELRCSYAYEAQQQYMKLDLSTEGPLTLFVDTLRFDARELKEQSLFISPWRVMALVEDIDFYRTFASRQLVDKHLIELWVAAIFTLCLGWGGDYYVRPVRNDPPDVEVLVLDGKARNMRGAMLEITQHGVHSIDLVDVIGKKLRKKYEQGTVLVVLVEQAETLLVNDLDDFIRRNNRYNQQIFIIGGSETPGTFKVIPWYEVNRPTSGETAWLEMVVDARNVSKGYRGYEGVVFRPPGSSFLPLHPVFVKELDLYR